MLTEYKVKLKGYLEWCKTAIRFAKLSQFINLNKDVVLQHVPELINPDELKSLLKKDFNTHAANILSSASFVADVGNVNWAELAKDKQAYQAQNNHNNSDNLEVSYCTINEDGGSIVAHDTNLLQPLKEYLVKKKKGDGLHLPPLPPADTNGLQKDLFRACYVYLQMDKLTKAQEKHLQLALSAVVNTLKTDKEVNMKKYIGEITFSHLSNMIKSENFHNECVYNDKANDAVKQIFKEYEEGGIMAVRIYISEEKIKMLKAGEYDGSSVVLKIYDIFLYIFDMIQFDFQNRHSYMMSENESFARWQYVFRVLFRCTIIQVRTGEILSQATREEMKEENGGFGCKIDMLTHGKDGEENRVELASNEHKKANAEYDLMFEQQSKNILSNICILSQLKKRFGVDISGSSTVTPLAMDVMGLRGYLYGVYKHEDVFVAAKKSDKHIVLPTTLAEFEEFSDNGSIFLLLNYMYYIVSAAEEILQNADNQTKRRFEAIVNDEYPVDDAPKLHFTYPNKKRHST